MKPLTNKSQKARWDAKKTLRYELHQLVRRILSISPSVSILPVLICTLLDIVVDTFPRVVLSETNSWPSPTQVEELPEACLDFFCRQRSTLLRVACWSHKKLAIKHFWKFHEIFEKMCFFFFGTTRSSISSAFCNFGITSRQDDSVGIPLGPAAGGKGTYPTKDYTLNVTTFRSTPYDPTTLPTFGYFHLKPRTGASASSSSSANYCYLILFNLNKKNNLGAILRSAAAFGVRLVLLVGRQGFKACLGGNVGQG